MSAFAAEWLALRAEADGRARNPAVAAAMEAHFAQHPGPVVLDLGAGTGATMDALAARLPRGQRWRLAEADPRLLERALPPCGAEAEPVLCDLAEGIAPLLDPVPDLVTASAFFDLAGAPWIDRLVEALARHRVPLYAALNYDGRERWSPPHRLDVAALVAFHADQQSNKGLGFALGPDAHGYLAAELRRQGFTVTEGPSDWCLEPPRDARLIAALAEGSARAIAPALGAEAQVWADARLCARQVLIGHRDLFAVPPGA